MKFGPIPIENAVNKILGHNVPGQDGKRLFRKGHLLSADDVATLRDLGKSSLYVAVLEPGDVQEDEAALRLAQKAAGDNLRLTGPASGRVNLSATTQGVLYVDEDRLLAVNQHPGITLATLPTYHAVELRQTVATVKIIPFAVPNTTLLNAELDLVTGGPLLKVVDFQQKRVAILLSGSGSVRNRLVEDFDVPLRQRLINLHAAAELTDFITLEDEGDEIALAEWLLNIVSSGFELVVVAGETAIMDQCDLVPRAIERAGGHVPVVGVPVDPGNLLMIGYLQDVPILGAPGCARSLKINAIDWVLPRLLVGEKLSHADMAALGHGGLLEDTSKRPRPRDQIT